MSKELKMRGGSVEDAELHTPDVVSDLPVSPSYHQVCIYAADTEGRANNKSKLSPEDMRKTVLGNVGLFRRRVLMRMKFGTYYNKVRPPPLLSYSRLDTLLLLFVPAAAAACRCVSFCLWG